MKNMEAAEYHGSEFGQDVEPKGTYVLEWDRNIKLFPGWIGGMANLTKPLYIDLDEYNNPIDYKMDLSTKFKAKGANLTKKLMSQGYDSIITRDKKYGTGEIVLFPNSKFMLDIGEGKSIIIKLLKESNLYER
jgi:hypothetical protein